MQTYCWCDKQFWTQDETQKSGKNETHKVDSSLKSQKLNKEIQKVLKEERLTQESLKLKYRCIYIFVWRFWVVDTWFSRKERINTQQLQSWRKCKYNYKFSCNVKTNFVSKTNDNTVKHKFIKVKLLENLNFFKYKLRVAQKILDILRKTADFQFLITMKKPSFKIIKQLKNRKTFSLDWMWNSPYQLPHLG